MKFNARLYNIYASLLIPLLKLKLVTAPQIRFGTFFMYNHWTK